MVFFCSRPEQPIDFRRNILFVQRTSDTASLIKCDFKFILYSRVRVRGRRTSTATVIILHWLHSGPQAKYTCLWRHTWAPIPLQVFNFLFTSNSNTSFSSLAYVTAQNSLIQENHRQIQKYGCLRIFVLKWNR